jgi:hypothetical protein
MPAKGDQKNFSLYTDHFFSAVRFGKGKSSSNFLEVPTCFLFATFIFPALEKS